MGKKKGLSPLLVVALVAVAFPYAVRSGETAEFDFEDFGFSNESDTNRSVYDMTGGLTCVFGIEPCSITIIGNIQLILFFAIILGVSAKIISDGAEMLLDLGLPPAIIGGIVLPLLGAVPDSAMIIASGSSGSAETADKQIAVGMGTLAGSTIMLLTIPWVGGLILGRVDIERGQGVDEKCSKLRPSSLWKQGVSVTPDVTYSAIVMLITALPYLIVQGADWYYGPHRKQDFNHNKPPPYIKHSAIATFVICMVFFVLYLVYLVIFSVASKRKDELRRQERIKRKVIKQMILTLQPSQRKKENEEGEAKPLLGQTGLQKKYFSAWKVHKKSPEASTEEEESIQESKVEKKVTESHSSESEEKEVEDPKWKIALKSAAYLIVGVGLVTIFSDPMVDALTNLVEPDNSKYFHMKDGRPHYGQHIPIPVFYLSFVVTPICSNASELVSSLIFASKKKKINSSMTFSQLYGAATMNNTLCLGIFAALVGFRGLTWQYSAEVTVILLVQVIMGVVALSYGFLYKHTYMLLLVFPVFLIYFGSILLVWMLEHFLGWK